MEGSKGRQSRLRWFDQHQVCGALAVWSGLCVLYTANATWSLNALELDVLWLYWQPVVPPLLMLYLWGHAVTRFAQLSVEYEQCFASKHKRYLLDGAEIQKIAVVLCAVTTSSAALFSLLAQQRMYVTAEAMPLLLYMGLVVVIFLPVNMLHRPTRQFFVATVIRVLLPFQEVSWADFLLADIFCSLSKSCADMMLALCHSATGPVMQSLVHRQYRPSSLCSPAAPLMLAAPCLPYIIRFIQCLIVHRTTSSKAQLFNAAKYASAFPALVLTALQHHAHSQGQPFQQHRLWTSAMLLNCVFSYYWDVEQDWDMPWLAAYARKKAAFSAAGEAHEGSSMARGPKLVGWQGLLPSLKPDLLYAPTAWYTWALVSNLALRFAWTFRLVSTLQDSRALVLLFACLEAWRRYQWAYIRIETELRKIATRSASAMSLSNMMSAPGGVLPPPRPPLAGTSMHGSTRDKAGNIMHGTAQDSGSSSGRHHAIGFGGFTPMEVPAQHPGQVHSLHRLHGSEGHLEQQHRALLLHPGGSESTSPTLVQRQHPTSHEEGLAAR